ncbi:MAG TPA: hypothetical protein VKB86_21970 [Pyrinomonadaceae bacterium]|nr:hypothetical protein [Pyrinomonadaceae bacterium]
MRDPAPLMSGRGERGDEVIDVGRRGQHYQPRQPYHSPECGRPLPSVEGEERVSSQTVAEEG